MILLECLHALSIPRVLTDSLTHVTRYVCVTPRFQVRPDWRIRIEFGVRDHILGLITCFFFFTESKYHIHIQKNYHWSGVHQNLYTYTESHLHIQKLYFYISKSEHGTYCDEPLLVCWPSCMRKFSDVFSCTYTD